MNLNIDTGPNSLDYMRVGVNTETYNDNVVKLLVRSISK